MNVGPYKSLGQIRQRVDCLYNLHLKRILHLHAHAYWKNGEEFHYGVANYVSLSLSSHAGEGETALFWGSIRESLGENTPEGFLEYVTEICMDFLRIAKEKKVKNLEWKDRRGKGDEIRRNNGLPAPYKDALSMKSVPMVSPEVTGTSITSKNKENW
ncbi:hypothetical protein AVEN_142334-1 [Araneus ventricosus]|uniref:Uncharacterized protein n=1 Tax=Araneus ventricosus TaxID=182803 RepID=A0A4Y2TAZ5_ARAVE|nr:hypothetical protein AVEN_142334-1 [Araneus ventricosus]